MLKFSPRLTDWSQLPDNCLFLHIDGDDLALSAENNAFLDHCLSTSEIPERFCYVAHWQGRPVIAIESELDKAPQIAAIKSFLCTQTAEAFQLITAAKSGLHFANIAHFCGCCGTPMQIKKNENARQCPACDYIIYPQFSPAVIVRIEKGNELLLAHGKHFRKGLYSLIAGFIEPGESAEATIEREVFEEVGLRVHNLKYISSQHWPFPGSFMLGFRADYLSGELKLQEDEILDAGWYSKNNLPDLPYTSSIARQLIDDFFK